MFDLEKSIAGWREQMLAAGIKFPDPLEELETHLREEIERQVKSGEDEAESFQNAVQQIGREQVLQREFKIVETENKMRRFVMVASRSIALIVGWFAASYALFVGGVISLDFDWNFFWFHAKWHWGTFFEFLIILGAETGIWFLARTSRDRASRVVSLLLCLFMAGFALYEVLPPEQLTGGFLGRSRPSPFWFRGGSALLLCLPAMFWIWWERRHVVQERDSARENPPVCLN